MVKIQLRVKRFYTYHIIRLALQNNISLRNGNMTTCPTDALKDNQSNPYPGGMKPKPKLPSSVSKLISLFWKRGPNSRICVSLHERKSASWKCRIPLKSNLFFVTKQFSTKEKRLFPTGPEVAVIVSMLPYNHRGHDLLKKSNAQTVGTGQVISSTNGSVGIAGIEGLILSPLLAVWQKSMADLEKALRHTVNGILYCWKLSPALLLPPSLHSTQTVN